MCSDQIHLKSHSYKSCQMQMCLQGDVQNQPPRPLEHIWFPVIKSDMSLKSLRWEEEGVKAMFINHPVHVLSFIYSR